MKKTENIDQFIVLNENWLKELTFLREIINATELHETIKWGGPVYTVNGKNVLGLGAFKNYVGIWFFNGALLKDEEKVLINAQEGTTVAMRQWRFNTVDDIDAVLVKKYVEEAINNQKEGREIKSVKKGALEIPKELSSVLEKDKVLKKAFESITIYKQREYSEYIMEAKREVTKQARIEKIVPMILQGIGLNDKYRNS